MKINLFIAGLALVLAAAPAGVFGQEIDTDQIDTDQIGTEQIDTGPFLDACYGNPNLLPMGEDDPVALESLCNCMAVDFAEAVSPDDIEILRRDLLGDLTDEERMAYETYEDLSAYAGDAMNACLIIEGLIDGEAAEPAQ